MVVFTVTLITLAFNPTSFIVLGLLAMAWIYLFVVRNSPIIIGGRTFRCVPEAMPRGPTVLSSMVPFVVGCSMHIVQRQAELQSRVLSGCD